jgi:hypothetical protein
MEARVLQLPLSCGILSRQRAKQSDTLPSHGPSLRRYHCRALHARRCSHSRMARHARRPGTGWKCPM